MLFRKNIEHSCSYCKLGTKLNDRQTACVRHGVVSSAYSCRSFVYDPFMRVPPKPAKIRKQGLTDDDFKIE
ncbi:hypothetical protein LJC34_04490 [Oscillospiraceae bacterium OttesenSCG-928-G22]|nr:hypothetical protein [Oscillospiraceae bacterium OttesenSCG-928-G22]